MKRLTDEHYALLEDMARGVVYQKPGHELLELHGLCEVGKSRFAHWARITDAGRARLETRSGKQPASVVATPTPGDPGVLLRGAVPRKRRITAK